MINAPSKQVLSVHELNSISYLVDSVVLFMYSTVHIFAFFSFFLSCSSSLHYTLLHFL